MSAPSRSVMQVVSSLTFTLRSDGDIGVLCRAGRRRELRASSGAELMRPLHA